jgi:uncharacterized membrane protein YedE/YeeE
VNAGTQTTTDDPRVLSDRAAQIAFRGALGLALGVSLGFIGFGDYGELARMFTFQDLRLYFTFGGAVLVTAIGLRLFVQQPLPTTPMHRAVPIGAALFGAGWALAGACPGIGLVQIGEGTMPAAVTFAGMLLGMRAYDYVNARWLRWGVGSCGA